MDKNTKNKNSGFVIAGTQSGAGKTTLTLGLIAWFFRMGYKVALFKVGPDFIDPGHHASVCGAVSRNLDGWMLSKEYNREAFNRFASDADIALVEGVMGLYDGYNGRNEDGSTAQMAKWLGLPVILVIDAKSMARSAAALIKGFVEFDPDLTFAGVVFNNVGTRKHYMYLAEAVGHRLSVPVLGYLSRQDAISIPERHLGLVTADEKSLGASEIDGLADMVEQNLDTRWLQACVGNRQGVTLPPTVPEAASAAVGIGVARDAAFCFYYQDNLDMLAAQGARLEFFSPIQDAALPENIAGLYFGGGYPEVFAAELAANQQMREAVKRACVNGMPIYGECGGFMYLCEWFSGKPVLGKRIAQKSAEPAHETEYPMTGCFPFSIRMLDRLKSLGYREVRLEADNILGPAGLSARGHEFHYSEIAYLSDSVRRVYALAGRKDGYTELEGYSVHNTLGSYIHLHFGSNPLLCGHFVSACRSYEHRLAAVNQSGAFCYEKDT